MYPAPSGVREDIHTRFLAAVARATLATALPHEVLAETPDEEEAEAEGLGAGSPGGYCEAEESA